MSLNGLSFVSATPAPQPCVSVLMVQGIQAYSHQIEMVSVGPSRFKDFVEKEH